MPSPTQPRRPNALGIDPNAAARARAGMQQQATPAAQAPLSPQQAQWDQIMGYVQPRSRAARAESEIYLGPQAIANDTNQLYSLLAGSPMFAGLLRQLTQQGSQMNTGFQSALGRTGLSSSGVGAAAGGLAKSATGNAIAGARADLFAQALQTALQALSQRLQAAPGFIEQRTAAPSVGEQIAGGLGRIGGALPGVGGVINAVRRPRREG